MNLESSGENHLLPAVLKCQRLLDGFSSEQVYNVLGLMDMCVEILIRDEASESMERGVAPDLMKLPLALGFIDLVSLAGHVAAVWSGKDTVRALDGSPVPTTAQGLAAFALAQSYIAIELAKSKNDPRRAAFAAMQAAEACGMAMVVAREHKLIDKLAVKSPTTIGAAGGRARWANDATQPMKAVVRQEWDLWQADRRKYRYPRDFRRAMTNLFPEAVDATLRNWMSKWGRERKS